MCVSKQNKVVTEGLNVREVENMRAEEASWQRCFLSLWKIWTLGWNCRSRKDASCGGDVRHHQLYPFGCGTTDVLDGVWLYGGGSMVGVGPVLV